MMMAIFLMLLSFFCYFDCCCFSSCKVVAATKDLKDLKRLFEKDVQEKLSLKN